MKPEILLSNGRYYNFRHPDPAVVTIEVIAHSLSHMCRFSGHVSRFYSVAEHCWRCSFIGPVEEALERLMHDAAESLVVDMPTPLKRMAGMDAYREADHTAERVIARRFGLTYPWPESVKTADLVMLATEKRDLMPKPIDDQTPWGILEGVTPLANVNLASHSGRPETWKSKFITRFTHLWDVRHGVAA